MKKNLVVALAGEPNVGKSTLLNQIIGEKISIVTHKAQTTRYNVKGIVTEGDTQLVFIDTPGLFQAGGKLEKIIVGNAMNGIKEADLICFIFDIRHPFSDMLDAVSKVVKKSNKRCFAIINKVDLMAREKALPIIERLSATEIFEEIFPISALKDEGVDHFKDFLLAQAQEGDWVFDEEQMTDQSVRSIAEEMTREQIFINMHEEIPYSVKVETEKWEEDDNRVTIYQSIFVVKESQKIIILGRGGSQIKNIGIKARKSIENLIGKSVDLRLFIKVREDWIDRS